MSLSAPDPLSWFEVPRAFVEPVVAALRLANTAVDALFYDVVVLTAELARRGIGVEIGSDAPSGPMPTRSMPLDLSALADPEGSIIVVDTATPPYVHRRFLDVKQFIAAVKSGEVHVRTVSITGVGSSALGSVAFAWNISAALGEPVAAIVPGYGVADIVAQALGGWFGFGLQELLLKDAAQVALARVAPQTARIGRALMISAPDHAEAPNGAPLFERGNGSSDVLHAILREVPGISQLYGHSKGALVIANAILGAATTPNRLRIVTFGCPVGMSLPSRDYRQILGWFDWLGWLNSWGNRPTQWIAATHTTNTMLPLSIPVAALTAAARA